MSEETWRLFVAIPVPDAVRAALAAAVQPVRQRLPAARWQSPDTWHLTLRFLGETERAAVPGLERAVRETAASGGPFRLALGEAGSFERRGRGRVAWIGLASGAPEVERLAQRLALACGAPAEATLPVQVHLTVARDAPDDLVGALAGALEAVRARNSPAGRPGRVGLGSGVRNGPEDAGPLAWIADRLVLYRSQLDRAGARHTPVFEARLGDRSGVAEEAAGR
ncbi:MAG: RNA 2',3'-cyclic phosphodiesterase [Candidatus Limnocylindrales bacterium]